MATYKKRTFYTDEECAMIVGNYRLTDGYERDYATRMGIEAPLLSHLKKRAIRDGLRKKFPEHFGDTTATDATLHVVDSRRTIEDNAMALGISSAKIAELEAELSIARQTNIRLANQLEKAKRRLGKAVSLLLDDE